jgi:hypothetical protein
MIECALDGLLTFPEGFRYTVHSKNNIAAEAITSLLDQYLDVHSR